MNCPCCGQPIDTTSVQGLSMIKLGPQERAILGELVRVFPDSVTNQRMQSVLYADDENGGSNYADKVVSIVIQTSSHLRGATVLA